MKNVNLFIVAAFAILLNGGLPALAEEVASTLSCEIVVEAGNTTLLKKEFSAPILRLKDAEPDSSATVYFSSGNMHFADPYDQVGAAVIGRFELHKSGLFRMSLMVEGNVQSPLDVSAESEITLTGQNPYPLKGTHFEILARPITLANGGYQNPVRMACSAQ